MSSGLADSIDLLTTLGDETRVRLLCLLEQEELTVAELTRITELSQPRVSTHLSKLRKAGLVRNRRSGSQQYYRLRPEQLEPSTSEVWRTVRGSLQDAVLDGDRRRLATLLQARGQGESWAESIAGRMAYHYSPGRTWEALTRALVGLLQLGDVLDIGCGDGTVAELIAPRANRYVGFDRSEKLLGAAARRLGESSVLQWRRGDMHALPFESQSFDQVLLLHVLTYSGQPATAMSEAKRVLRPGGRLVLATLARHPHSDIAERFGHVMPGFELIELQDLLRGLDVELCEITSRERRKPHFQVITAVAKKVDDG